MALPPLPPPVADVVEILRRELGADDAIAAVARGGLNAAASLLGPGELHGNAGPQHAPFQLWAHLWEVLAEQRPEAFLPSARRLSRDGPHSLALAYARRREPHDQGTGEPRARRADRQTRSHRSGARAARQTLTVESRDWSAAVSARHRHALSTRPVRRGRRLRSLRSSRPAIGVSRDRPVGEHHRRATTPRRDHQGRLDPRPPAADRSVLPLPTPARYRPITRIPPARPAAPDHKHRLARATPTQRPLESTQFKDTRKKPNGIAAVAIARELAGYCWEIALAD